MKYLFLLTILFIIHDSVNGQEIKSLVKEHPPTEYDNIYVSKLNHDSLASTFLIWVKKNVPLHYHENHSEVVYVIEGNGEMILNDLSRSIKQGDYIFIPKGTKHGVQVTSKSPMKVLSIQTPQFLGEDRHFVKQ